MERYVREMEVDEKYLNFTTNSIVKYGKYYLDDTVQGFIVLTEGIFIW